MGRPKKGKGALLPGVVALDEEVKMRIAEKHRMEKVAAMEEKLSKEEKRLVIRHKCVRDLHYLNQHVLKEEGAKYSLQGVHKELSKFVTGEGARKLILFPRGHFKTTVVTEGYSIQRIMENPEIRILIANATLENAKGFLRKIRGHFEGNEMFRFLNREILPTKDNKWTDREIVVNRKGTYQEATIETVGVGGVVVSKHYDLIIYDDLVNEETIATKEQREKLLKWFQNSLSLLEPHGQIVVVGTRWHFNDLYSHIENSMADFKVFKRGCTVSGESIDADGAEPVFPEKFSLDYLKQLRREQGNYVFNSQYMLNPIDDKNAIFRRDWMKYYEEEDLAQKDLRLYMTIDPAISQKDSGDYSAIVVCAVDEFNNVYVRDIKFGHWLPRELIGRIFDLNHFWRPIRIGIETVAFQKSLYYGIKDEMRERNDFLPLQELKTSTRITKEMRIRGLQPRFENGAIYLKRGMEELENQLLTFPVSSNDDILDALAYQNDLWTAPRGVLKRPERRGSEGKKRSWQVFDSLTGY